VRGWALEVDSPTREREAKALGEALKGLAQRIERGELKTAESIRLALPKATREAFEGAGLAASIPKWNLGFALKIVNLIVQFLADGKLSTMQDWMEFLLEIAAALLSVT
jgi:hypothetical protein